MMNKTTMTALAALAGCLFAAGNACATVVTADIGALGLLGTSGNGLPSPSAVDWNFTAPAGAGTLDFHLVGFRSLDGVNCCTDTFHLSVNSTEILRFSYSLGFSGGNAVFVDQNGATLSNYTFTGNWNGGSVDVSVPIALMPGGSQKITFAYSGSPQGLADEGWGISRATVTTVPLPAAGWLFGTALFGLGGFFRRKTA